MLPPLRQGDFKSASAPGLGFRVYGCYMMKMHTPAKTALELHFQKMFVLPEQTDETPTNRGRTDK